MTTITKPTIGVGAVIFNTQNQILLVLRKKHPEKDTWSIPGGKLELFEKLEEATIREVAEEIGIALTNVQLLCTAETIVPESDEHWVSIIYEAIDYTGTPEILESDAIADMQWFALTDLPPNIACFTTPALQAVRDRGKACD